ncbi:MAG: hypothetical protein ACE15F_21340, partial [bacterium]
MYDYYNAAQAYAQDAGETLGKQLLQYLGSSYSHKIHFIGHSLGTAVNAYAARTFLTKATGVKEAQFTALDRPHHIGIIPGCLIFPGCKGYNENFFGDIFHDLQSDPNRGLNLIIDNYYSKTGAGVGDTTTGLHVYNHPELKDPGKIADNVFYGESANDHSGVHQFYRWTMDPNGLYPGVCNAQTGELASLPSGLDASLNPCNRGWKWS